MCLYTELVVNKRYTVTQKNGGIIPTVYDDRLLHSPRECGECIECRIKKAREWQVRLSEEIKGNKNGKMVTLTFSNEEAMKLYYEVLPLEGYDADNAVATLAVRRFNERWRKETGKAVRHWLITELGHQNTENIHLHGILFTDKCYEFIRKKWKYGFIWPREGSTQKTYVNGKTINYLVKYVHKQDLDHINYKSKILTSAGIGSYYITSGRASNNTFNYENTKDYYTTDNGHKIALPTYYRRKIYTDEQREFLWSKNLDKEKAYILGKEIDLNNKNNKYYEILDRARKKGIQLGYYKMKKDENFLIRKEIENEKRIIQQSLRKTNKDEAIYQYRLNLLAEINEQIKIIDENNNTTD